MIRAKFHNQGGEILLAACDCDLFGKVLEDESGLCINLRGSFYDGPEVTEEELKQAFEAFGHVESTKIIKDMYTGRSRGFGFVEMPTKTEGESAITNLNGTMLKGRTLKVSEARPRREGGRRGGGRGSRQRFY